VSCSSHHRPCSPYCSRPSSRGATYEPKRGTCRIAVYRPSHGRPRTGPSRSRPSLSWFLSCFHPSFLLLFLFHSIPFSLSHSLTHWSLWPPHPSLLFFSPRALSPLSCRPHISYLPLSPPPSVCFFLNTLAAGCCEVTPTLSPSRLLDPLRERLRWSAAVEQRVSTLTATNARREWKRSLRSSSHSLDRV
jgi:hypothetical protein